MLDGTTSASTDVAPLTRIVSLPLDALKALLPITSQDETRYNLNGVFVEVDNEMTLRLVATDGHRLGMVTRTLTVPMDGTAVGKIKARATIKRSSIKQALDAFKKTTIKTVDLDVDKGTLSGPGLTLTDVLCDGTFPDYKQVIPKAHEPTTHVPAFNLAYLADFDELARLGINSKRRNDPVAIGVEPTGELTPIFVRMASHGTLGLIMPFRATLNR